VIRLRGVSFAYGGRPAVLDEVTLEIPSGLSVLVGPNGSGKSTLLRIAAGIELPAAGVVEIRGVNLWTEEAKARRGLAYVPEHPDRSPYATLSEILRLVCRLREEPLDRAPAALQAVGLAALGERSVRELSLGQRRRAILAAAMVGTPDTILLDEPLEAMDRAMRESILAWVAAAVARGALVVVATHEIEPFLEGTSRALSIRNGKASVREPLPTDPDERLALVERMARGE
jgi:ABC-type multidrug transport system ATPase subunit